MRNFLVAISWEVDVLTVEIEHIDATVLAELEAEGVPVHPSAGTLTTIQATPLLSFQMPSTDVFRCC